MSDYTEIQRMIIEFHQDFRRQVEEELQRRRAQKIKSKTRQTNTRKTRQVIDDDERRRRNREHMREMRKSDPEYRQREREATCAREKERRDKGGDTFREYHREWVRQWRAENRDHWTIKHRLYTHNRRSKESGKITVGEWKAICVTHGNKCVACGKPGDYRTLTMDHILAVVNGGKTEALNLQPLCRSCNSRKGAKTIDYRR